MAVKSIYYITNINKILNSNYNYIRFFGHNHVNIQGDQKALKFRF